MPLSATKDLALALSPKARGRPEQLETWDRLDALVHGGPEIQICLHLGSSIDEDGPVEEARRLLEDLDSYQEGPRLLLERKAKEALRDCYRNTWGKQEGLRRVLAEVGSQFAVFCPPFKPASKRNKDGLSPGRNLAALVTDSSQQRALLRLSQEVYHEYQRCLWDEGWKADVRADVRYQGRGWGPTGHRAPSPAPSTEDEEEYQMKSEGDEDKEFVTMAGSSSGSAIEEWHMHRYGCVCIFVLDTTGSRLSDHLSGLGQRSITPAIKAERPILSQKQWTALEEALADEATQVLVVASNEPLVLCTQDAAAAADDSGLRLADEPILTSSKGWAERPMELRRLLTALFEWKQEQFPSREVILASGGPGFCTTGDVCDNKLGLNIPAVILGTGLDHPSSPSGRATWRMEGNAIFDETRFTYHFRPAQQEWCFCSLDIDLSSCNKPSVDLQLFH